MIQIPEVRDTNIPAWLANYLRTLRSVLLRRFNGYPNRLEKVVTFQDLVDMGVVTETKALEQAEKK